jgi:hypothetical protein
MAGGVGGDARPSEPGEAVFMGSLGMYLWRRADPLKAQAFSTAAAARLICGDGLGILLSSVVALTHARAPICIKFVSSTNNVRLDAFLATLAKIS